MTENAQLSEKTGRKVAIKAGVALFGFLALLALIFVLDPARRYDWMVALHVIAVISWMAGMVYLPRLFVYHADATPGGEADLTFQVMERRLLKVIMTPAMILAWIFGLVLMYMAAWYFEPWFLLKLACVIAMSGMHGFLAKSVKRFASSENEIPAGRWRLLNEIPTVLMIAIVILVIIKPF